MSKINLFLAFLFSAFVVWSISLTAVKADYTYSGPYIINETETRTVLYVCSAQEITEEILQKITESLDEALKVWEDYVEQTPPQCWYNLRINITVLGQVGQEYTDLDGDVWRMVHVRWNDAEGGPREVYILTYLNGVRTPEEAAALEEAGPLTEEPEGTSE